MWDWLNLRRRSRRRTQESSQNTTRNDNIVNTPFGGSPLPTSTSRSVTQPFFVPTPISESPPKCISRLPCSQILYGERVEDFSSECWLENHLHRFGFPSNASVPIPNTVSQSSALYEENDDSITGSSETDDGLIDYSDLEIDSDFMFTPSSRPQLALEQLFMPIELTDIDTDFDIIEPPPYSEFDPPPSYEEAVQHLDRRSTGTRSSNGSSLAFMW